VFDPDMKPTPPTASGDSPEPYPTPFTAFVLVLAATFASALVFSLLAGQPFVAAMGIAEAIGIGGVATLAARRVPEPQAARMGLRPFDPQLLVPILCLLSSVILVSELDNWVRVWLPASSMPTPTPALAEMQSELTQATLVDSVYGLIQTGIVSIGIVPVVQGFLFFGVVQQGLMGALGRWQGVGLTAFLYSLIHFPMFVSAGDAIIPIVASLTVGTLLALSRLASGSILPAIMLEALLQLIKLGAFAAEPWLSIPGFNADGDHTPFGVVLVSVIVLLLGLRPLIERAQSAQLSWSEAGATREDDSSM
jgi:hypothetical protein